MRELGRTERKKLCTRVLDTRAAGEVLGCSSERREGCGGARPSSFVLLLNCFRFNSDVQLPPGSQHRKKRNYKEWIADLKSRRCCGKSAQGDLLHHEAVHHWF